MKHARDEEPVSLALSLTTDSPTTSCTTSGAPAAAASKRARRGRVVATSGEGEFVCKTCGRAFTSFQALGGHRTSHLRGRHGLALGLACTEPAAPKKTENDYKPAPVHRCHVCGVEFEMWQVLGGHMRRHRDEAAAVAPPVLLQLFV